MSYVYIIEAREAEGCTPFEVLYGSTQLVYATEAEAEAVMDDLAGETCWGPDGSLPSEEVGIIYIVRRVAVTDLERAWRDQAIEYDLLPADENDEDK